MNMKKLLLIAFALLMTVGGFAQDEQKPKKAKKEKTYNEKGEVETEKKFGIDGNEIVEETRESAGE